MAAIALRKESYKLQNLRSCPMATEPIATTISQSVTHPRPLLIPIDTNLLIEFTLIIGLQEEGTQELIYTYLNYT